MVGSNSNQHRRRRSFNKPSWLLCTIADLDERVKTLTRKKTRKENSPDSFAGRANSYYHERPQLLELLNDLYNSYLSLADRYCQALATKQHRDSRCSSPLPNLKIDQNIQPDEGDPGEVIDSPNAESSLSFQSPVAVVPQASEKMNADMIFADLVMKMVEYDIVLNELNVVETRWGESSRKMELQKNLLDVLESERLILLNDNATLGYRVTVLEEENKGLASESLFLKRKAAELARCVLKAREDHRVCMLSRKIEDLQGQIYGLEKRNKEYYEQLVMKRQGEDLSLSLSLSSKGRRKKGGGGEVELEDCFRVGAGGLGKCFSFQKKKVGDRDENGRMRLSTSKLWDMIKKFDLLHCGPHFDSTAS
ncbi:Kinase interacting (KIP1-like) family protein [Striga hermonthica]|uniref:Kinase interacting (KIP1-like) family protein n=1 Tax=Striga hermonthica TaxID=68872 RepID=A0A9N7RG80_STRHE|nr:Kinase interacting (KIP1-like) family protein [Striga hermonthica]